MLLSDETFSSENDEKSKRESMASSLSPSSSSGKFMLRQSRLQFPETQTTSNVINGLHNPFALNLSSGSGLGKFFLFVVVVIE